MGSISKTILFVAEKTKTALMQKRRLAGAGFNVIHAPFYENAVEIIRSGQYIIDLIMMDVKARDGNFQECRTAVQNQDIPVLFMYSPAEKEIESNTEDINTYGFVPIDANKTILLASIDLAFKLSGARQKLQSQILELETAKTELLKSEAKLRAIYDILPTGISIIDQQRRFIDINPALEKILDISKDELINGTHKNRRYINSDGSETHPNQFASSIALETGAPVYDIVTGIEKENGEIIWTSVSAAPLPGTGVVISTTDISELKQAEEALYESEETYRLLFENSLEAVFFSEPNGNIYKCNNVAKNLFGYTEEEFQHLGREGILDHNDQNHCMALKERENTGKFRGVLRFKKKDGTVFPAEVESKIFKLKDGAPRTFNVIRDITEGTLAQKKLKSSNDQLHGLAVHLQTIREEEKASIARDIHDEFGAVLTALKIELSLIDKYIRTSKSPEKSNILSEIHEMQAMISNTMNSMYRIISELRPEMLTKLGLIKSLQLLASEFEKRNKIKCSFSSNVDFINVEEHQALAIYRIVQESFSNIAKHAGADQSDISILRNDTTINIIISDNGKGFDPDKIYDKVSYGIAGMKERLPVFSGKLNIFSAPGAGTKLEISIPFDQTISHI